MGTPISGHLARLDVAGANVALTAEDCNVIAGTGNVNWRVTDAAKTVLDWGTTFTVEANDGGWNTLAVTEYQIKYLTGTIIIDNYTSGTGVVTNITDVRITGNHRPLYEMVEAESANVDLLSNLLMVSVFGNNGERRIQGRIDGSVNYSDLERLYTPIDTPTDAETSLGQLMLNGNPTIVSIYPDRNNTQYAIRMAVVVENGAVALPGGEKFTNTLNMPASVQTPAMSSQTLDAWELLE